MNSGLIIHTFFDEQDIRKKGSMILKNPISSLYLLIGNLSLMGFPFFAGYYSKDTILEIILIYPLFFFIIFFSILAALFTTIYSWRLFYYVYLSNNNYPFIFNNLTKNSNFYEIICLLILFTFSFTIGYFFKYLVTYDEVVIINNKLRYIPLLFCILGTLLVIFLINYKIFKNNLYSYLNKSYLIDNNINVMASYLYKVMITYYKLIDIQIINKISLIFISKNTNQLITNLLFFNRGLLFNYFIFFFIFIFLMI